MNEVKLYRFAGLLAVFCMITSCFVGGTMAKYTSVAEGSDNARVATWGFGDGTSLTFDLFDANYINVSGKNGDNVIAPGTSKTSKFLLSYDNSAGKGAPEVAYTVDLNVENTTEISSEIKNNSNITWSFNGASFGTWDTMLSAIENYHQDVSAGNLPTINTTGIEIKWQWAIGSNGNDNEIGNMATQPTVKLDVEVVVTQKD